MLVLVMAKAGDIRNTARWQRIRAAIKRRDNHMCQHCGATHGLSVHHIVPIDHGGEQWHDGNLITLCAPCHHHADVRTGAAGTVKAGRRARRHRRRTRVGVKNLSAPRSNTSVSGVSPPEFLTSRDW